LEPPSRRPSSSSSHRYRVFALSLLLFFAAPALAQEGLERPVDLSKPLTPGELTFKISTVVLLTLVNGLFAMAETALVSIRRSRVEQLIEENARGARAVKTLVENPPRFIATTQIGITLLGFAAVASAATSLAAPLLPLFRRVGLGASAAETASVIAVTVLIALLTMVLGEIAPKSLAVQAPDRWALRLAPFINFCAILFAPLSWIVVRVAGVLVRPFGAKAEFEQPMITKEELEHIINEGEEHGQLDTDEQVILKNVFDLTETIVRKVMTPRRDMTAVPIEADLQAVLSTIMDSGHSRLPVYEGTTDNIVGIVHAKDLLPLLRSDDPTGQTLDLRRAMRAATFVPESKSVLELLNEFRLSNQQVAIIKDEYGGTEGLVTIEDLLEEIVGPIHDEYDRDEPTIVPVSSGEWHIEGRQTIGDVNDALGTDLPESETYDTISGWIFNQLGREPLPGDHVRSENFEFIVEQVEGMRIQSLRALRTATGEADESANDDRTGAVALPAPARTGDTSNEGNGRNGESDGNGARAFGPAPSGKTNDEKPAPIR